MYFVSTMPVERHSVFLNKEKRPVMQLQVIECYKFTNKSVFLFDPNMPNKTNIPSNSHNIQ